MKRLLSIALFALLTACAPQVVVITATPQPPTLAPVEVTRVIVVTATDAPTTMPVPSATATLRPTSVPPDATPTRETWYSNEHARCANSSVLPDNCVVNANAALLPPITSLNIAGRRYDVPAGLIADSRAAVPPIVECRNNLDGNADCVFKVAYIDGQHGYVQSFTTFASPASAPTHRYLVAVRWAISVTPRAGFVFDASTAVQLVGELTSSAGGVVTVLPPRAISVQAGSGSTLWVTRTERQYNEATLAVRFFIPYGIYGSDSTVTLNAIDIMAVPANWGGSDAIQF